MASHELNENKFNVKVIWSYILVRLCVLSGLYKSETKCGKKFKFDTQQVAIEGHSTSRAAERQRGTK